MDITSLAAMGVIGECEREVRRALGLDYGWVGFPVDDWEVWADVQRGDTTGVFQFEGQTIQQRREEFKLRSLSDLTLTGQNALNAIRCCSSCDRPRSSRNLPIAPATIANTTSFTVPPSSFFMSFTCDSSNVVQSKRR